MKYKECLRVCAGNIYGDDDAARLYMSYPPPTTKEWSQCLAEARIINGTRVCAHSYMSRYEVMLARKGIQTVGENKAELYIELMLQEGGVAPEIALAMAARIPSWTEYKDIKFSGPPIWFSGFANAEMGSDFNPE